MLKAVRYRYGGVWMYLWTGWNGMDGEKSDSSRKGVKVGIFGVGWEGYFPVLNGI